MVRTVNVFQPCGWEAGWAAGWLAGWPAGRLVGWLVGWHAGVKMLTVSVFLIKI